MPRWFAARRIGVSVNGTHRSETPSRTVDAPPLKRGRHDPDHFVRFTIELQRGAERVGTAAEAPLPQAVADDDHARLTGLIFVRPEHATASGLDADGREEVGGDLHAAQSLRFSGASQGGVPRHHGGNRLEGLRARAVIDEDRRRRGGVAFGVGVPDEEHAIRIPQRQWLEERRVEHAEDGHACRDGNRQRRDDDERRGRRVANRTDAVTKTVGDDPAWTTLNSLG